jgi:ADP-heptose:LPS heptosyltransferase
MQKILLIQIKGYGDFIICCNYLRKVNKNRYNIKLICAQKFKELAKLFLPKFIKIEYVDDNYCNLFYAKKNFFTIYKSFKIRKILKQEINLGYKIIVFDSDIKLKLLFFGISFDNYTKKKIYDSYASFFNIQINSKIDYKVSIKNKILIFPFGSTKLKQLQNNQIKIFIDYFDFFSFKDYLIVIHNDHKPIIESYPNLMIYNRFKDLVKIIKSSDLIITTDTVCLHLAILLNKPTYVLSNSSNKFIPFHLENRNIFKYEEIRKLLDSF